MSTPEALKHSEYAGGAKHLQPSDSHAVVHKAATSQSSKHHRLPKHPIPCMQAAFEESIMEYSEEAFPYVREKLNAHARRQQLLEEDTFGNEYSARWRQKPGSKFHPLWKLIAQISFGIHLLHKRTAKSDHEVVKILQTHVDEIDSFLEDTMADFDFAAGDIEERIEYLILPLHNGRTFEKMLTDRIFRSAILDGNDVIERIIARTSGAMNNALDDVLNGLEGVAELAKYLDRLGSEWTQDNEDLRAIYAAMRANAEGWYACFKSIQLKGEHLRLQCTVLQSTVTEVARRCGMVSRRGQSSRARRDVSGASAKSHRSASRMASFDKPLPPDPLTKALAERVNHHASEASASLQISTSHSPVTRSSDSETPVFEMTPPAATPTPNSSAIPEEQACTKTLTTKMPIAVVTTQLYDPVQSQMPSKDISGTLSSQLRVMADSAYSSCSNSVANSPKTKTEKPPLASLDKATPTYVLSPQSAVARNSVASLTALPQTSITETRRELHPTKSGLGSLKGLFLKKHADRGKTFTTGTLGGNVEF